MIGFAHEQNRPDRDQYITVNWDNIREEDRYIFEVYTEDFNTLGLPYDFESTMHYEADGYAIDESIPTMVPKIPGVQIKPAELMSKLDVLAVQKLYRCI